MTGKRKTFSISIWKLRGDRWAWNLYRGPEVLLDGSTSQLTLTIQAALVALQRHERKQR